MALAMSPFTDTEMTAIDAAAARRTDAQEWRECKPTKQGAPAPLAPGVAELLNMLGLPQRKPEQSK